MDLFSISGKFYSFMTKVADLIILSVLWLLTSLPVITLGASGSALYYTMNYALNIQWSMFAQQAFYTLQLALSLAVGIIGVTTLVRLFTALTHKHKQESPRFHHSIR